MIEVSEVTEMSTESKPAGFSRWDLWTTALVAGLVLALGNRIENRFSIHGYHLVLLILAEVATMFVISATAHLTGKISRVRPRPK